MVNKKKRRQKKPKRSPRNKVTLKTHLIRTFAGIGVLILLVVAAGVATHHLLLRKHLIGPESKPPVAKKPPFEIYPEEDIPSVPPLPKPKPRLPEELPKIAIIIDDVGYDRDMVEKFLGLDAVFTFSVLPHNPFQRSIAMAAQTKGIDIMLHLPMEPNEYPAINPGPGALMTSMSPDELISQLIRNLDAVPMIKGVNNHMGSKMTAVSTQMYQIFSILKKRDLFFIDSRTTVDTLCKPSARLFKVPFAQRDVFIDHIQEPDFIRNQLDLLLQIAKHRGEAIGIAHPHDITYSILREALPKLKEHSILVPASEVVHIIG
jgi:polysaccharide deacetylase 2 family uncharacterized protein YibQ